jgi:hypothetical protein
MTVRSPAWTTPPIVLPEVITTEPTLATPKMNPAFFELIEIRAFLGAA